MGRLLEALGLGDMGCNKIHCAGLMLLPVACTPVIVNEMHIPMVHRDHSFLERTRASKMETDCFSSLM
jgi:hypothetical protein